jgi:hypothetical protein
MSEINQKGLTGIREFLIANHKGASTLLGISSLWDDLIENLETQYRNTGRSDLKISPLYLVDGGEGHLAILAEWMDDYVTPLCSEYEGCDSYTINTKKEDNRIGINDEIKPQLKQKRISSW